MINKWRKLGEKNVFKDGIVDIVHKDFYYEEVKGSMPFTVLKMINWALVVPVTAENEFIVVRQFRAGPEADTLEFPGGGVNNNEPPALAAARELTEETGAEAEEIVPLGVMDPNPAFMSNKCNVFLAKNARLTGKQRLDKFEDTEALIIPYDEMMRMVKDGRFRQSLSIAALGLYIMNGGK